MISLSPVRAFAEPVFNDFFGGYGYTRVPYYFNASEGKWVPVYGWRVDFLNEGYSILGRHKYYEFSIDGKQVYLYHFDMDKSAPYRGLKYTNCRDKETGSAYVDGGGYATQIIGYATPTPNCPLDLNCGPAYSWYRYDGDVVCITQGSSLVFATQEAIDNGSGQKGICYSRYGCSGLHYCTADEKALRGEATGGGVVVCDEQYMSFDCSAGQQVIAHVGSPEFSQAAGQKEKPPMSTGACEEKENDCGLKILEFTYEPKILYYGLDMWPYIKLSGRLPVDHANVNLEIGNLILGMDISQGNDPYFNFSAIFWLGNQWGFFIEPGTYPATLTITNSTCSVSKTIDIVVDYPDECEVDMSVSPGEVSPQSTAGNTQAEVTLTLKKPAPEECTVDLKVYPEVNSGGHDHHDAMRPTGSISPGSITFYEGETGPKTATYTSPEVAGTEEIVATDAKTGKVLKKMQIDVKVKGLVPLGGGDLRLTGQTNAHSGNHYGTSNTVEKAKLIAETFYNEFKATLGINDMSLEWGGLFDIGPPQGSYWSPPHKSHRKGTSVDIDRNALGSKGWIKVPRDKIEDICNAYGHLVPEPTIHCEMTK